MTDNKGVAKWEDRTHYAEITIEDEMPETTFTTEDWPSGFRADLDLNAAPTSMDSGDVYIVVFDGVSYEQTSTVNDGCLLIGGSTVPFLLEYVPDDYFRIYTDDNEPTTHTVTYYRKKETVCALAEKYIPDVIVRKAELSPVIADAEGVFSGTYDGTIDGRDAFKFRGSSYYKIAEFAPAPEMLTSFVGTRSTGAESSDINVGINACICGLFIVVSKVGECGFQLSTGKIESIEAPSPGLYAMHSSNAALTAGDYKFTYKTKVLRVVSLSTLKTYALDVDNSGNLVATEV